MQNILGKIKRSKSKEKSQKQPLLPKKKHGAGDGEPVVETAEDNPATVEDKGTVE